MIIGFIAGVILIGLAVGVWLQIKVDRSHQDIKNPSALGPAH